MSTQKKSLAGSIYLFCIGLFLFALGAGFCWLLANSYGNAVNTRHWVETPCLIIHSDMTKRSDRNIASEYRWEVLYKYQFANGDYTCELYKPIDQSRGQKWSKSIESVKKLIATYPEGAESTCYVNPKQPEVAVLAHDTRAAGYTIWFPALFSIGGIGMMVGAARGMFNRNDAHDAQLA